MIRYIPIDERRFAMFDTVVDRFLTLGNTQAWDSIDDLNRDLVDYGEMGTSTATRIISVAKGGIAERGRLVVHPSIVAVQVRGPIVIQNPIQQFDTMVIDEGQTMTWIGAADRAALANVLIASQGSETMDVRGKT